MIHQHGPVTVALQFFLFIFLLILGIVTYIDLYCSHCAGYWYCSITGGPMQLQVPHSSHLLELT